MNNGVKMENGIQEKLEEFLKHELEDFGIEYKIVYEDGTCYVDFKSEMGNESTAYFSVENDNLRIDMFDDHWETIKWWDWSVKHFWIKIAPEIWPTSGS